MPNAFRLWLALCLLAVLGPAEEKVDLAAIHRIKAEAFENSRVMDHVFYLTEVHGSRITNSPGFHAAADWVVKRLREWGFANVTKEKWGPFGRSWHLKRFSAHLLEPSYAPLIGFPLAWTTSTEGAITGEPVLAVMNTDADLERFKGKLRGKIVLIEAARPLSPWFTPLARRYSDGDLAGLLMAPEPGERRGPPAPPTQPVMGPQRNFAELRQFRAKLNKFLTNEGAAAILTPGLRGGGGTVFGSAAGSREEKETLPPPTVALTPEHYNRLVRLLEKKVPVKVEVEVASKILVDDKDSYNVIAELPGEGKKDEVVMLGGHLDSWHGGTGAADNAAGVAVTMEAVRILKTLNLRPDRTVRLALWSAEEQGLLGSRAYVKQHFADPEKMELKAEHAKLCAYFNLDNGTGKIRGIYLQGNDALRPIFEAWLKPFHDLGAATVTIRNTTGTDHLAFDAVGLPGFQFIQDPVEYSTRVHHSNMDVYDLLQPGDLMQASAIMASFVYHAAMRPEMLPRKPLLKPGAGRRGRPEGRPSAETGL